MLDESSVLVEQERGPELEGARENAVVPTLDDAEKGD